MLLEGNRSSARPQPVLEHVFCLLDKLIVDRLPSMLGFQSEKSSTSISLTTEWSDGCCDIMTPYGRFDHVIDQSVIHLVKGVDMSHACCEVTFNGSSFHRVWIPNLTCRGGGIYSSNRPYNICNRGIVTISFVDISVR